MSQPADQDNRSRPRVVLLATDRSQSIIGEIVDGQSQTIAYSAYGEQSAQQKIETRLGFNGQLREANIGWYLLGNGYRAYNPRLMRFHSPDSWSPFRGGGLNAYMYCVGDPVNRVDPTGHNSFSKVAGRVFDFLFGGPNVTGSRGLSIKQAQVVQKLGGLRPENTGELADLVTAGAPVLQPIPRVGRVGKNSGGEFHGTATWGTNNVPDYASIGTASSGTKRSIPMVVKDHTKTVSSGTQSRFNSKPPDPTQSNSNSKPPAPHIVKIEASLPIYQAQLSPAPPSYEDVMRPAQEVRNS
ncbi:hypothetical protein D3C76_774000 [compost metagenome]